MRTADPRLQPPRWRGPAARRRADRSLRLLIPAGVALAGWYFAWLLDPSRIGNPLLYGLLVGAELFNLVQAAGFWWTCAHGRPGGRSREAHWKGPPPTVDVLIPVYNEPLDVVAPTVWAATELTGADVRVFLLDDAGRAELAELAQRAGAGYLRREEHTGAKAGNLNHALRYVQAEFVVVFDCDHVPHPRFLARTLGHLQNPEVAFVQTPQYYANSRSGPLAAAAWAQQALFFGGIARGKDALGAMFCCGTNVVFRRTALDHAGGFPERSLTEDFELSIRLHALGWRSVYVDEVLAQGLGPEDMASYVSQQQRWARGCLRGIPTALAARMPWRLKSQYLLSSMFFLSGWTFALYMALPAIRMFTGGQPLAQATADQFLIHFAPYYAVSLSMVALAGAGEYTFAGFALMIANYSVQILSSLYVLAGRKGRFVVTAKRGQDRPQPLTVLPALVAMTALGAAVVYAMSTTAVDAATLNNVAFALLHISILLAGAWPALVGRRRSVPPPAKSMPTPSERRETVAA